MSKKQPKKKEKLAWKREEGWVQFNPPPKHPQYEEWMKRKEKHDEQKSSKQL